MIRLSAVETRHYKLEELAEAAKVSPRTVRYYVQRGLLPAPTFRGRDTAYDAEHLVRLRAIKQLQERFLPLDAIESAIARASREELEKLAAGESHQGPIHLARQRVPPAHPVQHEPTAETLTRWVLAPGLELTLSAHAGADTRSLAEALRTWCEKHRKGDV